jgi:dipeptide/tripeptide permease
MSTIAVSSWLDRLKNLGPMRWFLLASALVLIVFVPGPGTRAVLHGPAVIPTVIIPALAPIVLMVVLLDALMSAVFMADKHGEERARMKLALTLNLVSAGLLVAAWYPYFRAIASG